MQRRLKHAERENLVYEEGSSPESDVHCPLHRAMVTGEMSEEPFLVFAQHKQGYRIPLEVSVAPLRDPAGRMVGGIEVFLDQTTMMTDLRRAKPDMRSHLRSPDEMNWSNTTWAPLAKSPYCASHNVSALGSASE